MAAPTPTLGHVRAQAIAWLSERGVSGAANDVDHLLSAALEMGRMQLHLQLERPLTEPELAAIRPLLKRRGQREPLSWILGSWGFHGIDLRVHADVLHPRPDTETLVDAALEHLPSGEGEPIFVADVGCGTGAVGLAIAAARPRVRLYAIDLSEPALANTRENVAQLGLAARVAVLRGDLLAPIPANRPIDWVVSNPPYIPTDEIDTLMPEVSRWEPRAALDGGPDGLDLVRALAAQAAARARRGLLLEIGRDQAPATVAILREAGFAQISTRRDLRGIERVVLGLREGSGGDSVAP